MNNDFFVIIPSNLIYDEKYKCLTSNAILLYSLFLNRTHFSKQNKKFKDDKGVFIYYSANQISNHIHCSSNSAKRVLYELEQAGLVRKEYQKNGLPLKIYVNDIRTGNNGTYSASQKPQDRLSLKSQINSSEQQKPCKNDFSQQEKQVSFDVGKADEMALKHLYNFAEKKQKRRTRNTDSTM